MPPTPRSGRPRRVRTTLAALVLALVSTVVAVTGLTADPAAAAAPGWLHTSGSRILDSDGRPHVVRAVSWFGMETPNCAPHGLWSIGLDQGLAQIASFGFNAIRLPYSNECLAAGGVTGVDAAKNPGLVGKTPLQVMDAVVAGAKAHGLSVILDRHRPDSGSQSPLWYTDRWSEARWISDWTMLAQRYRDEPTVVGVDLHNEPHADACWGCGDATRDWALAATRAGNAVLQANPNLLVVVEGVENTSTGSSWWGGGLADAGTHPVTLDVPGRLVYSPHDYPASIYSQPWFSAPDYPQNLPARWDSQWGYLQKQGIAPVLVGEFGTRLETTSDRQWLATLVGYLRDNQMSFAYWSFNPNSGDTGGLVADDWTTPQTAKLAALAPILGPSSGGTATPSPTPTPSPTRTSSPAPTASPTRTSSPAPTPSPTPTRSPTPTTSPSPSPSPSSGGSSATAASDKLRAGWQLKSAWQGGYVAEVTMTLPKNARKARTGWTLRWNDAGLTSVVNAWGMRCTPKAGVVTCTGLDWGARLQPGQTVTVGLQAASRGAGPTAPKLSLS